MSVNALFIIGIALVTGLYSSLFFKKLGLPQVIGQMCIGIVLGISGFQLLGNHNIGDFTVFSELALGIIGFIIGGELRYARLKKIGLSILSITLFESTFSTLFVFCAVYFYSNNLALSFLIGALAAATAPGGTTQVIQEYRARGPLTNTLYGVVGADDAFAIMIYTLAYNVSKTILIAEKGLNFGIVMYHAMTEIFGSIILGCFLGFVFIMLMERLRGNETRQLFTLSFVLIASGLALHFNLSLILTTMALGIFVGNYKPHQARSYFQSLNQLTTPIYMLFFILIGANFQLALLPKIGLLGIIYIIFRTLGKISGAWFGGVMSDAPSTVKKYLGLCLLSQAGVALGLAIAAQNELNRLGLVHGSHLSDLGVLIVNVVTGTTLIFQIIGPLTAKFALQRAGETRES